jgi:hypothetical protein
MILEGKKVSLRPMTVEEITTFYEWATQSEATPFWYGELQGDKVPSYEKFLKAGKDIISTVARQRKAEVLSFSLTVEPSARSIIIKSTEKTIRLNWTLSLPRTGIRIKATGPMLFRPSPGICFKR